MNRETHAGNFNISNEQLRHKSHLVVRVIPEAALISLQSFDFIELCGSDLAAASEIASDTRESERDRKFASTTFNSISK